MISDNDQEAVNKLGKEMEEKFADVITANEPNEKTLVAAVAALSATMVAVATTGFGDSEGMNIISFAINNAVKKYKEMKSNESSDMRGQELG